MAIDHRLDLGRYVLNPFDQRGSIAKRLDFGDLFRSKADSGEYPWNPSRFTERDLLKRMMTRKVTLNPSLNYTSNAPFFDDNSKVTPEYDMFGLGRFNRSDYNFDEGRPVTSQRPEDQPDFNSQWVEAYKLSPTVNPEKRASNPMPRTKNPDPRGFLMAMAEKRAENEVENNLSISQLLQRKDANTKPEENKDKTEGETVINQVETNISPGKTVS